MAVNSKISSFSTLIIFTVLTAIGFAMVPLLSIQFLPTAQTPGITVRYFWQDAAPEVLEREVTATLEGAFNLIAGIERIYSISGRNGGSIRLDLDKNAELDFLRFEIASKIRQLFPQLPQGLSYPQIFVNDPEQKAIDRPILSYSLSGDDSPVVLYRYAREALSPRLALTQGIRRIEVAGGNDIEWQIIYDDQSMRRLGILPENILTALKEHFSSESLGTVSQGERMFLVTLKNAKNPDPSNPEPRTPEPLTAIPLLQAGGRLLSLGDIADIRLREQKPLQFFRINGQNSIRLLFYPERNVNSLRVAGKIKKQIESLRRSMPPTYRLRIEDDATAYLSKELAKIKQRTFWSLGILLLFVLLVYRSFRYLTIVLLSLLANLGLAFLFYYWLKVELHLYALAAVTVSFGLIIDNSIVMMHHLKSQGNLKVFPALLASTLTTISALVIIWFLPEKWQINLLDFAKVLAINLGISLVVALWLIPALMNKILGANDAGSIRDMRNFARAVRRKRRIVRFNRLYEKILSLLFRFRKTAILAVILLFGLPVFMLPNKIKDWSLYNKVLGNEWYIEYVKPLVNKSLGGCLRLFVWYVYEGAAYRQPEETVLHIQGSMPQGATPEQLNAVFEKVETYLSQFDVEIHQFITNVRSGQFAATQVFFNKGYDLSFPFQLKSRMIAFSLNLGGVKWNIYGVGKGFSNDNTSMPPRFRISMKGYNQDELHHQAEIFAQKLEAHPRIREVNTEANFNWWEKDLYQFELEPNRQRLAGYKLQPLQLRQVFPTFNRTESPDFFLPGAQALRLINRQLPSNGLWDLNNKSQPIDSTFALFSDISRLTKQKIATTIHKENQQYIQMVEFEYTGSARFGSKYLNAKMEEMRKEMPLGYSLERKTWRWGKDRHKQYGLLLLVVALIFFICSITFESLRQAFAIILLIPTSFIGIFLTFYWFDFNFDQGGYTSFLLLSGLVVNSLILILNDFNAFKNRFPGRPPVSVYLKAFNHKITPILLTILSTALGFIPFLMFGQQEVFWFSLAAGTIGGLLFSILVIVLFIPLFFVRDYSKNR